MNADFTRPLYDEERALLVARTEEVRSRTANANIEASIQQAHERIALSIAERKDTIDRAHDIHGTVYHFVGEISNKSINECMERLNYWNRTRPRDEAWEIVFYSPGGDVVAGMALFDFIRSLQAQGHHITTTAIGLAASMAAVLLQAGSTRAMGREAWLLIHQGSFGAHGSAGTTQDAMKWFEEVQKRIVRIFADRCQATDAIAKLDAATIEQRWERKDWWIDSSEALSLGLNDEVR